MNELKFPDEDINSLVPVFASDSTIIKEGWLWKQGNEQRWGEDEVLSDERRWSGEKLETTLVCHHRWVSLLLRIANGKSEDSVLRSPFEGLF